MDRKPLSLEEAEPAKAIRQSFNVEDVVGLNKAIEELKDVIELPKRTSA